MTHLCKRSNTKIGFASKSFRLRSRLKIDPVLRNLLVWLVLFALSYTLWAGSSVALAATREPRTMYSRVWNISEGQSGNITLSIKENGWSFDTQVPEEYAALFSEGDCLVLTYYESPLQASDPFGVFRKYVTKIHPGDACE
jgi:hypothetical protein